MQETSNNQSHIFAAGIARWWRNWVGNRAGRAELESFNSDELRRVAMDVGVNARELCSMAGRWPESSNLLLRRMATLGLDAREIDRSQPSVSNDLNRLCSMCVRRNDAITNSPRTRSKQEYCPNVSTLTAWTAGRVVQANNEKRQDASVNRKAGNLIAALGRNCIRCSSAAAACRPRHREDPNFVRAIARAVTPSTTARPPRSRPDAHAASQISGRNIEGGR